MMNFFINTIKLIRKVIEYIYVVGKLILLCCSIIFSLFIVGTSCYYMNLCVFCIASAISCCLIYWAFVIYCVNKYSFREGSQVKNDSWNDFYLKYLKCVCSSVLIFVFIAFWGYGRFKNELPVQTEWIDYKFHIETLVSLNKSDKNEEDMFPSEISCTLEQVQIKEVLMNMSPEEASRFYKANYKKKSCLIEIFRSIIIPFAEQSDYFELKNVCNNLSGTPLFEIVDSVTQLRKSFLLKEIKNEIDQNRTDQIIFFKDSITQYFLNEIDSFLIKHTEKFVNDYSGGFLEYKKLEALLGKGVTYAEKLWYKNVNNDKNINSNILEKYLDIYVRQLCESRNEYYENWGYHSVHNISLHDINFMYPWNEEVREKVSHYTNSETFLIMRDWILDVTGIGGLFIGTCVWGYEILSSWDDASPEQKLSLFLVLHTKKQLINEFSKQALLLEKRLKKEDEDMYRLIKMNL